MATSREPAYGLMTVVSWLAVLWVVELTDWVLTFVYGIPAMGVDPGGLGGGLLDYRYGLVPHSTRGLIGIAFAPLLHGGFQHLIANSLALAVLLWLSFKAYNWLTWVAVLYAMVTSGLLTWYIAPPDTIHVGASGVIFGLIGFLLANGIFRRGCLPLLISLLVVLLYGGSLSLMAPQHGLEQISWQMHLGGFIGGLIASWHVRGERQDAKPA